MMKVTLDAETRAKLHDLSEQVELYDEGGKLVGIVVPTDRNQPTGFDPFSEDDVTRALSNTGSARPLDVIIREHGSA
jgi:hypothetical protein